MSVKKQENFGLRHPECNRDCELGAPTLNPQSAIRNPQSDRSPLPALRSSLFALRPFHACSPRRGVNLTEVLIALGILTLGLLGVASIFPVGSFYINKAQIADNGSAIAQAVMSDIVARGVLNPSAWLAPVPNPRAQAPGSWNTGFAADGKYSPARLNPTIWPATFTRPFAETLSQALTQPAVTPGSVQYDPTLIGKQVGSAFVIDPIGVAAMAARNHSNNQRNVIARPFPASVFSLNLATSFYGNAWQAWGTTVDSWPIRRLTLQQSDGWAASPQMASYYFQGSDDLATDFPDRDDRPAAQNWDTLVNNSGTATPLARQWTGDYSWIVTVVPTTNAARDGMARNPESFAYDVSVVVFHKRPLPVALPQTSFEMVSAASGERTVRASILSTGLTGGELLLTALRDGSESPYMHLKTGQWIMLCGPHPNNTPSYPRFAMHWYQVLSIDTEGKGIQGFNPNDNRVVTVRGPQWPWLPSTNGPAYTNDVANSLCVGVCRGAVAVHTKTLRLQSLRGSAGPGMALVVPPGVAPPTHVGY